MALTPKPSDAIRIGQVLLDKYRVESILGQGGMGVVVECTHVQLNERVALKLLRQDVMLDRDAVERFKREGQAAAKLKSEYVARVRDVGELENGTPFMVMEYLDGQDLGVLLTERGSLPMPWATELILQTCEALAEAHSYGIVHRDVKPTNLFVTWRPDGTALIKVLDFGISKSATGVGQDMHLTQTQSLLGTPAYMSPEQMRSARLVDGRTDIWSLGSVLYELIEGHKPFEAESFSEMCVKVAVDAPAPMTKAPYELQQVVLRCLEKTPEARYQSMGDLARDLVPFTQDPQSATMLVERMQRMQRRGEGTWEGSTTGVGMRGVPHHVRDVGSAPVRQSSPGGWHGGSEPMAPMFRTPPGGVPLQRAAEKSAPAVAPSEFHTIPTKRGRVGFVMLGVTLFCGAAIAIVLGLKGGGHQARSIEPAQKMDDTSAETTPAPAAVPTAATAPTAPTAPVAPAVPAVPVGSDPKPAIVDATSPDTSATKTVKATKAPVKATPKKQQVATTKKTEKVDKVEKDPKEPKDSAPSSKPPCDPFAEARARPCAK